MIRMFRFNRVRAFTLVELLVVIGIVGVLIAILLPVLANARRHAQLAQCSSNLRQIGTLASGWASEHRGFLPLDGEVEVPLGTRGRGSLPAALNDSEKKRYAYHYDPNDPIPLRTIDRPMPFFVALLSSTIKGGDRLAQLVPDYKWSRTEALFPQARIFRCPAAQPMRYRAYYKGWVEGVFEGGSTMLLVTGNLRDRTVWYTNIDYGSNGGLLGYHYSRQFDHRRYGGRLSAVKNSARMVMCAEAGGIWPGWIPALERSTRHVTLADAWGSTPEVPYAPPLDQGRHQRKMNLLFVDGHVETVPIDQTALAHCDLLQE